ncbi:MAG: hypothetical protein ACREIA_00900 [Opitutaceae bacterium]
MDDFYLGQIFLVRLGGPPVGVAPENDYSWRWEEIPWYPAARRWDGVTIEPDFPKWNWQNWPTTWWMTGPEDDDPALEPLFGTGPTARMSFETAEELRAIERLQRRRQIRELSRFEVLVYQVLSLELFLAGEVDRSLSNGPVSYVVYEKLQPVTGRVYSGRTWGRGQVAEILQGRDNAHIIMNYFQGFYSATAKAYMTTVGVSDFGYHAMRGREQHHIDYHGGSVSDRGGYDNVGLHNRFRATNKIRGVAKDNKRGRDYHYTSIAAFGGLEDFSGHPWIQGALVVPDRVFIVVPTSLPPQFYPN